MDIQEHFSNILKEKNSSPFLFIGSGFSRRYLGVENWSELLSKFAENLKHPYEYYYSTANQNLPQTASLIAKDYHDAFWNSSDFEQLRKKHQKKVVNDTSALKISIGNHLQSLNIKGLQNEEYREEIELLNSLNVDGIITTNWDTLLEELLPDYKVYIGQDELLFCNPQSIGEIYKIHGCASKPESLVLTSEDYKYFNSKNAYLAAKLITLFIEHPIIFIGYALGDSNIQEILSSIVKCLGKDKINELQNNLIFIQRTKGNEIDNISSSIMVIDDFQLPITIVKTSTFTPIYKAINTIERKIPTRILRYCKEQIFELVKSENPNKQLCVVDFDNIEDKSDIEFVVGLGVIEKHMSAIGYRSIKPSDLFEDLIFQNKKYNARDILQTSIPELTGYLPVYKYLKEIGVNSIDDYNKNKLRINVHLRTLQDYQSKQYRKQYLDNCFISRLSPNEIIQKFPAFKAMVYLPYCTINETDLPIIKEFLNITFDEYWKTEHRYRTFYRKLACLYDNLMYGWN